MLRYKRESRSLRKEGREPDVVYQATDVYFTSEEEDYKRGEIGGGADWDIRLNIEADSLESLFQKVKRKLYMEDKKYAWGVELPYLNGRTCFAVQFIANSDNELASDSEISAWKRGKERLYNVDGRVIIQKISRSLNVPDEELEYFAKQNDLEIIG